MAISTFYNLVFLFLLYFSAIICGAPIKAKLIEPKPFTIIRKNTIRLKAKIEDRNIQEVRFYARYGLEHLHKRKVAVVNIANVRTPPYEAVWNIKDIPDQSYWATKFWIEIVDHSKKVLNRQGELDKVSFVVVDRMRQASLKMVESYFVSHSPEIDGLGLDWNFKKNYHFSNADNTIKFKSCWNNEALFFIVDVEDPYLSIKNKPERMQEFDNSKIGQLALWENDMVEFSFDLNNNKNSLKQLDDPELLVSASGLYEGVIIDFKNKSEIIWGRDIKCQVRIIGTANNDNDLDSGYTIEVKIPWKCLAIRPQPTRIIGFDLFNFDYSSIKGIGLFSSFSGVTLPANDIPSHWASLRLVQDQAEKGLNLLAEFRNVSNKIKNVGNGIALSILAGSFLIAFLALFAIKYRKAKTIKHARTVDLNHQERIKTHSEPIRLALDFINQNYNKEFNLEDIARHASVTTFWLSRLFKKQTGMTIQNYINKIRINKAKELLDNSTKNISEIAYMVGYQDQGYFTKVFRKTEGISPGEYRKRKS